MSVTSTIQSRPRENRISKHNLLFTILGFVILLKFVKVQIKVLIFPVIKIGTLIGTLNGLGGLEREEVHLSTLLDVWASFPKH